MQKAKAELLRLAYTLHPMEPILEVQVSDESGYAFVSAEDFFTGRGLPNDEIFDFEVDSLASISRGML